MSETGREGEKEIKLINEKFTRRAQATNPIYKDLLYSGEGAQHWRRLQSKQKQKQKTKNKREAKAKEQKKIAVGYADKANKSRNEEQTSSRENKTETSAENNKTTNNNNSSNNIKTTTTTARAAKICNINIFVSQTVLVGA